LKQLLENIQEKINGKFDSDFIKFVQHHQLHHWFIKNQNLSSIQAESVRKLYHHKKLHNLLLIDEWTKLKKVSQNFCNIYLFKGICLSHQLFGDALTRPTRDLDLWINKKDILVADIILNESGYYRIKPSIEINKKQLSFSQGKILRNITRKYRKRFGLNNEQILIELENTLYPMLANSPDIVKPEISPKYAQVIIAEEAK